MKYISYIFMISNLLVITGCSLDLTEQGRRSAAIKNSNQCYNSGGRLEFIDGEYYCDLSGDRDSSTHNHIEYHRIRN